MIAGNRRRGRHSYNINALQSLLSSLSLDSTDLLEVNDLDIFPTQSEIFANSRPTIAPNKIDGPYSSVTQYLKMQYDLLREDFLGPLRHDLTSYAKGHPKDSLQNVHFHDIRFIRKGAKHKSTCHCVEILSKLDKEVIAPDSKRLITGSFVLFCIDGIHTVICGKVEDNDQLKSQRLLISLCPDTHVVFNKMYTMIEYTVFFEPYYSALKALKGMSDCTFPMKRYIVDVDLPVRRPKYLIEKCISRPDNLNRSQLSAWINTLNKEFVLIQGPPGTGKTFLGLEIVKDLIINCEGESPILVVTYKNHALDQFIEGLLETTNDIIRLGGQSKNPKMADLSIKNQRNRQGKLKNCSISPLAVNKFYKRLADAEMKIKGPGSKLDMMLTGEAIVNFSFVCDLASFCDTWENVEFGSEEDIIMWLLQDDGHVEDVSLLEKGASLLSLFSSSMWLFSMSTIKTVCAEIEDAINSKAPKPSSVKIRNELLRLSNDKLKKLKALLLKKIAKVKDYMASDLVPLYVDGLPDHQRMDPFTIPVCERWKLYRTWINQLAKYFHQRIDSAIDEYKKAYEEFDQVSIPDSVQLMKKMKVIGMTTTCAARMRDTLERLQCPIVVIEEAAEVLEAHVVSAVTKHCKHLILIGDHQQLRPAVADYEIDTKYNLGVSLFERMVLNGIDCHTLDVQHRMRPEISSLIVPAIYPRLQDHESVRKYPNVRGMDGNVFFLDHDKPEADAGQCSKKNIHEAKFLIKLAEYLLMNGYKPDEITILAAYLGQVSELNKEKRLTSYDIMKNVAIKSVDDYQGEENKIILLSLVRNNKHAKIGFLSNEKRVCVALSRAREGLYIMGNMKHLSARSKLWRQIKETLKSQNAVGPKLRLKCQIHGNITYVDSPKDFDPIKLGGCMENCATRLECSHVCRKQCHGLDSSHVAIFSCRKKCIRHPCAIHKETKCNKLCGEKCGPCEVRTNLRLDCGHVAKCYMITSDEDTYCREIVKIKLKCNHVVKIECYREKMLKESCPTCSRRHRRV